MGSWSRVFFKLQRKTFNLNLGNETKYLISNGLIISHHLPILLPTLFQTSTVDNFDLVQSRTANS